MTSQADLELATLKRLTSRTRSVAARLTWRSARQRRRAHVGHILDRALDAVRAASPHRVKVEKGWSVSARAASGMVTVMTVVTYTPGRTIAQLAEPVTVTVHRVGLVD